MLQRIFAASVCAGLVTLALGSLSIGCSPRAVGGQKPSSVTARGCITTGSPPPSGALPVQYPPSRVTVALEVSERFINAQLDEHLPIVVAEEKERSIGVAGLANYRVKRGSLSLDQRAGMLFATLPLSIDISVCKPLGSACLRYGSCTPRLDIEVQLEDTLSSKYEVSSPHLGSITKERCRIGIDVTPQLESAAHNELAKIQRRLDRTVSLVDESITTWAAQDHTPLTTWPEQCLSWSVTGVRQRPLRLEHLDGEAQVPGKHVTFGLEATGQLALAECDPAQQSAPPATLPAPRIAQSLPKTSEIHVPEHVSVSTLTEALHTQLDSALGPHRLTQLQVAADGLYLKIELGGEECGEAWFKAQLRVLDAALRLDQPVVLSPPRRSHEQLVSKLAATLKARFAAPLLGTAWIKNEGKRWLKDLIAPAQAQLVARDLSFSVGNFQTRPAAVQMAPSGVYVFHAATFQLRIGQAQRRSDRLGSLETDDD